MDTTFSVKTPAKVVVLGGTGFLGRAVTRALLGHRHQVRLLVRDPQRVQHLIQPGAKILAGDALDPQALLAACQGAEYVVDMVAVRRNQPQSLIEVNVDGPKRLIEASRRMGVKGIVFVSAIGAGLDPKYKYLSSRFMGEEELRRSNIPTTILRFSVLLGQDGGIVRDFERVAALGPVAVVPGDGQTQLQPMVREDAARCVAEAVSRTEHAGQTLNLGGPEVLTYEQLFEMFLEARAIRKRRVKLPVQVLKPAAHAMEMYLADPVVVPDELRTIVLDSLADGLDVVAANFGFRPESPSEWIPRHWGQRLAA